MLTNYPRRRQLRGGVFTAVCLRVFFSRQYLKNRITKRDSNVPWWVLETRLFWGQRSWVTKTLLACFALLWVLASSSYVISDYLQHWTKIWYRVWWNVMICIAHRIHCSLMSKTWVDSWRKSLMPKNQL